MESIPFHALKIGADKLPPDAFEKIPIAGKYFREDKDKKERRRRDDNRSPRDNRDYSDSGSDSESFYSRDNRSRGAPRRHGRSRRDWSRSRDDRNRGYDSDRGPRGYEEPPRFPPPPMVPIINEPVQQHNVPPNNASQTFIPARYNPQTFGQAAGEARDSYFTGHPQEQAPFTAPIPNQQQQAPSQAGTADTNQRSSIADRYRPSNYDGRASSPYSNRSQDRGSHGEDYPSALTLRHPSPGGNPGYSPPAYSPYDSGEESDRRRRRSKSRDSRRSRSRAASVRVKEEFQKHKKDIGSASLGIVAGGILGSVLAGQVGGGGHKKKSSKANIGGMLLGAALGGISATALERRHEKKKDRRREHPDGYDSY